MYSILIVDDEKKEREGISRLLKRYHFNLKISQAANGEEALKEFEKHEYDILLTDIKMPFMDGIQLIKEIQKRGMNPICIIYSAYGEFEYAQNAISLGVLEYLLKPIRLDAFEELTCAGRRMRLRRRRSRQDRPMRRSPLTGLAGIFWAIWKGMEQPEKGRQLIKKRR